MNKYFDRLRIYDGSKGVKLSNCGALVCDQLNLTKPALVKELYASYRQAGSEIIQTNTFSCNGRILKNHGLLEQLAAISYHGVKLAKEVAGDAIKVAASLGPTGEYLLPYGDLDAVAITEAYAPALQAMEAADYLHFETFSDLHELRLVIITAKDLTTLPMIATMTFGNGSVTTSGNPADVCAYQLMRLGCVAVGVNCGAGPNTLFEPLELMQQVCDLPLVAKPNAGIPQLSNNQLIYDYTPSEFAQACLPLLNLNVKLIGGCCGSDERHIDALKTQLPNLDKTYHPPITKYLTTLRTMRSIDTINPSDIIIYNLENQTNLDLANALELDDHHVLHLIGSVAIPWEHWNNLAIMIKAPLMVSGNPAFIESALHYYPGVIGVYGTTIDPTIIEYYGGWQIDLNGIGY